MATRTSAWDAIWDVATRIDSLGWTAEYRIPLSQLHYSSKGGGHVRHADLARRPASYRDVYLAALATVEVRPRVPVRQPHRSRWPRQRRPRGGHALPRHQERHGRRVHRLGRSQDVSVGGDLRYRLASNLLVNATVNPDFGQVEADPSELNLSAFETFFGERRPFFVEGKGLFTLHGELRRRRRLQHRRGAVLLAPDRPLAAAGRHLRRSDLADATQILGAAKMTGRMPGRLLDRRARRGDRSGLGAWRHDDRADQNYAVVRGNQDFSEGNAASASC